MSSKSRNRKGVATDNAPLIATNDDAFQSKVAAMRAGYFEDTALATMANKSTAFHANRGTFRRPPVINRDGKVPQIVSIGAGFDTHPCALLNNARRIPPFHYVELDFPEVVLEKTVFMNEALGDQDFCFKSLAIDNETPQMVSVAKRNEAVSFEECTDCFKAKTQQLKDRNISIYSTRGVDLRDVKKLATVLDDLAVSSEAPTLILAEIVLVYMEPEHSDALISFFSERFTGSRAFVVIEHTSQDDEFGRQMTLNIAARGSPLLGLRLYPTMESQEVRFKKLGWRFVKVESLLRAFEKRVVNRLALNRIEILDEVEEWSLIMSHYCIVCATEGHGAEKLLDCLDVGKFHDTTFRSYESGQSEPKSGNTALC